MQFAPARFVCDAPPHDEDAGVNAIGADNNTVVMLHGLELFRNQVSKQPG
jgi:hypothetical protein